MGRVGVEDLVHLLERFTPVENKSAFQLILPDTGSYIPSHNLHGLRAEEPDVETGKECKGAKEKEGAVLDVLKHGWGDETNDKVAQPVGAGGDGDTLGSTT